MEPSKQIRVAVVDDHDLMRRGLRRLIEEDPRLLVVADFAFVEELQTRILGSRPDIVLIDLDGQREVIDLLAALLQAAPELPVLLLTSDVSSSVAARAITVGAQGLIGKDADPHLLRQGLIKVSEGELWLTRSMMASVINSLRTAHEQASPEEERIRTLSEREREVIQLLGLGLNNRQIGNHIHLSESTVRHHLTSIYRKLDVEDRLALLIFAYRHGLVE